MLTKVKMLYYNKIMKIS